MKYNEASKFYPLVRLVTGSQCPSSCGCYPLPPYAHSSSFSVQEIKSTNKNSRNQATSHFLPWQNVFRVDPWVSACSNTYNIRCHQCWTWLEQIEGSLRSLQLQLAEDCFILYVIIYWFGSEFFQCMLWMCFLNGWFFSFVKMKLDS